MRRPSPKHLISFLLVITTVGLGCPAPAAAVSAHGLSVYPTGQQGSATPWLRYQLAGGEQTRGSITVANSSDQAATALVYPVDAAIGNQGSFTMLSATSPRSDVGGWLQLDDSQITIPAHRSRTVGFQFAVPANASVGPHYGGIIVQPLETRSQQTSSQTTITVVSRLGVRLYETVPGAQAPALRIESLRQQQKAGQLLITADLKNTGNTLLAPRGHLRITDTFGRTISDTTMNGDLLPSGQTAQLQTTVQLGKRLPGRLTAHLDLAYADSKSVSQKTSFWWSGKRLLVYLVIEIGVIAVVVLVFRHSTKRFKS